MTRLDIGAVGTARALRSHLEDVVRFGLVHAPRPRPTPRERAFAEYLRRVRRIMRSDAASFEIIENRLLARGAQSCLIELTLRTRAAVEPGDMLHLFWRNAPERALAAAESLLPGVHWTTPIPHRPARRMRYTAEQLAASVLDLSDAPATVSLRRTPRIAPRFYTVSEATAQGLVRLQVTRVDAWPERAAAFLHRLSPGDVIEARVLPHPHRVRRDQPGLAVVTGSGAAGVFAALRAGARGVRLLWGVGDKSVEPWVLDELEQHRASGALAELHLVRAPERVTDALALEGRRALEGLRDAGWLYISGHEAMGRDVDALLAERLGREELAHRAAQLRYIVST